MITFKEMLRMLMPQVDKTSERVSRLRHFAEDHVMPRAGLSDQQLLVKAGEMIAKWAEGIDPTHFKYALEPDFRRWWAMQTSAARSEAAKKRKAKRKSGKLTLARHK